MPEEKPYRLYAMEVMSLAGKMTDPELATHYRALAAAYMALAHFHERSKQYRLPKWEDERDSAAANH